MEGMYEPLDLQTPQLALWLGIIFVVAALAILFHARWRQKRRERELTNRGALYEGRDSRVEAEDAVFDTKREGYAGLGVMIAGAAMIVFSVFYNIGELEKLEKNVQTKYEMIDDVDGHQWRGHVLESTVTTTDGQRYEGVRIRFDPNTGEPTIIGDWPELTGEDPEDPKDQ